MRKQTTLLISNALVCYVCPFHIKYTKIDFPRVGTIPMIHECYRRQAVYTTVTSMFTSNRFDQTHKVASSVGAKLARTTSAYADPLLGIQDFVHFSFFTITIARLFIPYL